MVSEDSEVFQLWETPRGQFWVPPTGDLYTLTYLLAEQECHIYETDEVGVRSGDIVFDCGANIGVYTRNALNCGAKLVVAIEPSPMNSKCLQKNFKTEVEQGRVIIYEKGVWNREEILTFYTSEGSVQDSFVLSNKDSHTIAVPVTTIDKIVKELKLDRVDFIKMDIEGSEQNALIGAKETISKYRPRIVVANEYSSDQEAGQIVSIVRNFYPNNQTQCGICEINRERRLHPHILFFH